MVQKTRFAFQKGISRNIGAFFYFCIMTADELKIMQEESLRRHLEKHFNFIDGELRPKIAPRKKYKKREKNIMPDLMAAQITLPCTSDKKEDIPIIKKSDVMSISIHDKPYVPKPVQEKKKRPYVHFTALPPEPPKQRGERPPAVYSNSVSYYGVYDELKKEWLKK